jgi:hypothetical protein
LHEDVNVRFRRLLRKDFQNFLASTQPRHKEVEISAQRFDLLSLLVICVNQHRLFKAGFVELWISISSTPSGG